MTTIHESFATFVHEPFRFEAQPHYDIPSEARAVEDFLNGRAPRVGVDGVEGVHDLHVWSLSSEVRALSAHVVVDGHPTLEEAQVIGERVKHAIAVPFHIAHATLELECEACAQDPMCIDASFALEMSDGHGHGH